LSIRQLCAW